MKVAGLQYVVRIYTRPLIEPFSHMFFPIMRRTSYSLLFALFVGFLLVPSPVQAQQGIDDLSDLRGALQSVSENYADQYVQPATDAFGANINSGLFRTADVGAGLLPLLPFDVYLGVSLSGTLTSSMKTSFTPTASESFNGFTARVEGPDETVPTIFGETEPPNARLVVEDENGNVVADNPAPQGLLDTPVAPLPIPQLGLGSIAGTDVQVRYFPKTNLCYGGGCYGKVGVFGLAVRHDVDQWFPAPLPFNVAVQGAWNQFSLESEFAGETSEALDGSGWAFNVQASKGVPVVPLVFYGGLQYETFNVDYEYTFPLNNAPDPEIALEQTAANQFRAIAGFSFTLAVIRLNVDYAFGGSNNVVSTGLGIRL